MMRALLSALAVVVVGGGGAAPETCDFNPLCTCRRSHHELICRGVPFSRFPSIPPEHIYQVTVVRSGLEALPDAFLLGTSVASLHLPHNELRLLSPGAFAGLEPLLATLDLSHNRLDRFPAASLHRLRHLTWLSLHHNRMGNVPPHHHWHHWPLLDSLFLGGNLITSIPEDAFLNVNLTVLDLEGNDIDDVGSSSLPPSLRSLTLSDNLLRKVPLHALYHLRHLRRLQLAGNLLSHLPSPFILHVTWLDQLDLSHNMLVRLPEGVFNGSYAIKELRLDFNFIRMLSARSFKGTKLDRLFLANNRISSIHSDTFVGIEKTLTTLDFSYNLLEEFPSALNDLKILLYLSLKGNLLKVLDRGDLHGCRNSLEVLDLSGNRLRHVPKLTLQSFTRLLRLSLQDNHIEKVYRDDFERWGHSLLTLSLANNKMTYLSGSTFVHLTKLKELKLSFNNLMYLDQNVFLPVRKTLEVLELSAAFSQFNHPLDLFVRHLERLEWLQLDYNNISQMSSSALASLTKLRHFDIGSNDLVEIPMNLFVPSAHTQLSAFHISNNAITILKSGTFNELQHISSTVLFKNKISVVESGAFAHCPSLHTIVLSNNAIFSIQPAAFRNLTRLTNVFLQDNRLDTFSFDIIESETANLYINLSCNFLKELHSSNSTENKSLSVRTLDISNNQISVISSRFVQTISEHLLHLFLSHNDISNLSFIVLPHIQILHLSFNKIKNVGTADLAGVPDVQILLLDHNNISHVEEDTFSNLTKLRVLDLSYNRISMLTENAFAGTQLERLNLSQNSIVRIPFPLPDTLRHLDLSLNRIESFSFEGANRIQALNLSSNRIAFLHERTFLALNQLLELDLSHNPLSDSLKEEVLAPLSSLLSLRLRNASLTNLPELHLPQLRSLSVRDNALSNVSERVLEVSRRLLSLDLSGNFLPDVPVQLWWMCRRLVSLDLSRNPIEVLDINSFSHLERLRELDISALPLKRLDPRALHGLRFLSSLRTDSYASVRSFRLQDLLSNAPALRRISLSVEEATLSHQLQGAFGIKLRELHITGLNLRRILPDAFAGLTTHELTLRIGGTSVSRFPDGLLKYLPDVRYLTLDLRNNRIDSLQPRVLAAVTKDGPDLFQTQHVAGGVLLEENPWRCGCDLLWLGRWLRRWMRETFHAHRLGAEAALYVDAVARRATCSLPGPANATIPIIEMRSADLGCGAVRSQAIAADPPALWLLAVLVLVASRSLIG